MDGECVIEACDQVPVAWVPVFHHILAFEIVAREKGSGRVRAAAHVCSVHERELADGKRLKVSRFARLRAEV